MYVFKSIKMDKANIWIWGTCFSVPRGVPYKQALFTVYIIVTGISGIKYTCICTLYTINL